MNIEGSNLLSMLSGSDVPGMGTSGLPAAGGANTGFSAAFIEQLGALQAGLASQQTTLQTAELGKLPADAQAAMQSFAALFGKNLPQAGKIEKNIDLNDTLQALADVMQHLQAFGSQAANTQAIAVGVKPETMQPKPLATTENDGQQQLIDVGLLAAMTQAVPTTQTAPVIDNSEPEHSTQTDETQSEALHVNEQLAAQMAAPSPAVVLQPQADSAAPVLTSDTTLLVAIPANHKSLAGTQPFFRDSQTLPQTVANDSDDFGLEFERSIGALLGPGNAGEHVGKDGQSELSKGENPFVLLDGSGSSANMVTADKSAVDFAAEMGKLSQALPASASAKTAVSAVTTQLGNPVWNEDLGQKLIWMHKQALPSAELRLNPEHLGPVLVKIDVRQDQASITFTVQHQVVRDAIEAAIPKLREMFSGQQIQLADVNVSQHQQQSEQRQARDFFQAASEQGRGRQANNGDELTDAGLSESLNIADEIEAGRAIAGNGLLSLFA